jgi:DnaK suppressor protein
MEALTKEQIGKLQARLQQHRAAALGTVQDEIQRTRDPDDLSLEKIPSDAGDRSEADLETDTTISMAQRHAAELQEIDAALARIADGSYGVCEECDRNIGAPRLEAQPTARRCIACQEQLEQRPDAPPRPTM